MNPRLTRALAVTVLVLLAAVPYLPGLPGDFEFDDHQVIVNNDDLTVPAPTLDAWLDAAFSAPGTGLVMRPLAMLTFAAERAWHGVDPAPYKLTNMAIHAVNAVLVLALSCRLLPLLAPGAPLLATAWATAAVWAVHPINLTSVLYVVQRMTSLTATFTLAALLIYTGARLHQRAGERVTAWPWCGVALFGVLGMLTKETAASLAAYLVVLELTVLRCAGGPAVRRTWTALAMFGVVLTLGVLVAAPDALFGAYRGREFTLAERLLTEARVVADYLRLLLLPVPGSFALFHDDIVLSRGLWSPPSTAFALLLIALLLASAGWRQRAPFVMFGCYWFLGGHLLESTVLPLELMHEHRNYLPALGPLLIMVCGAERAFARARRPAAAALATLLAVLVLGGLTALRASLWRDINVQMEFEVLHHPQSARLNYEAGRLRIARAGLARDPALYDAGIVALERAAELAAHPALAYASLLKAAVQRRDTGAVERLIETVRRSSNDWVKVDVLRDLIYCQAYSECRHDAASVQALAGAVLEHAAVGDAARDYGLEWLAIYYVRVLGDTAAALNIMQDLVARSPADAHLLLRLAEVQATAGDRAASRATARAALAVEPWHAAVSRRREHRRLLTLAAADVAGAPADERR